MEMDYVFNGTRIVEKQLITEVGPLLLLFDSVPRSAFRVVFFIFRAGKVLILSSFLAIGPNKELVAPSPTPDVRL